MCGTPSKMSVVLSEWWKGEGRVTIISTKTVDGPIGTHISSCYKYRINSYPNPCSFHLLYFHCQGLFFFSSSSSNFTHRSSFVFLSIDL